MAGFYIKKVIAKSAAKGDASAVSYTHLSTGTPNI